VKAIKKMSLDTTFNKCAIAPWQPPKQVFIVVWSFLYFFYILTLYKSRKSSALTSLLLGLAINLTWSPLYVFDSKLGLFVISVMIVLAIDSYEKLNVENLKNEARFIQIYLAWLVFAFTLNAYIAYKCKS
jgi:tryptophan-rich sensory protein